VLVHKQPRRSKEEGQSWVTCLKSGYEETISLSLLLLEMSVKRPASSRGLYCEVQEAVRTTGSSTGGAQAGEVS